MIASHQISKGVENVMRKYFLLLAVIFISTFFSISYAGNIKHDIVAKNIQICDDKQNLVIKINYADGCKIQELIVRGKNTLSGSGVFTGFRTKGRSFSSNSTKDIKVAESNDKIILKNIVYGDHSMKVDETWTFSLRNNKVHWDIDRSYSALAKVEEMSFPQWNFADLLVWKGGILDNGGMVWCKYLSDINDTYGVHTGGVTFWNPETNNALRISTHTNKDTFVASKYSQSDQGEFTFTQFVTDTELEPRYYLNRFVHKHSDVFVPFNVSKGNISINLEIEYIDYATAYSRGKLPGIDAIAVRELMNTTGRYGVVDNTIVGGNGWITNWKCLHEPFFAQIGMALNDENYVKNMSSTLDAERDYALTEEGRVLSRWHNADDDQMPGTFNYKTGYYEARWGYTVDSQTGYIINAAEQFDLCGDLNWLKEHKESCESALNWLIKRDSNNNGIFEMMNDYTSQGIASDWLDIVWASFENAFVNAQMYEALNLWANCELILGDKTKSDYYYSVASKLKENFNKPIEEGGFWAPEKKQYIYWRDKDGSVHGDNFVTPVNFAVIAFGLCDDKDRVKIILDEIEKRTSAEKLFHWPLCFDSYREEEVSSRQWPFPEYENGDIFPTWGYLGVRSYVGYNKEIALKYIKNILEQYNKDGLSSQRYSRVTQEGRGDDILAGICTSVTALYRDIYGIRPKWNRMGVEPNMSKMLDGTEFSYTLRGIEYSLKLSVNNYELSADGFTIKSKDKFGAERTGKNLKYYYLNKENSILAIDADSDHSINLEINNWGKSGCSWKVASSDSYTFTLTGLIPESSYTVSINGQKQSLKSGKEGSIQMKHLNKKPTVYTVTGILL